MQRFPALGQSIRHAIKANYLREMCFPQHKLTRETKAKYINEHAAGRERADDGDFRAETNFLIKSSPQMYKAGLDNRLLCDTGNKWTKTEFQNRARHWMWHNHTAIRDKKISDCPLLAEQIRLASQNKPRVQRCTGKTAEGRTDATQSLKDCKPGNFTRAWVKEEFANTDNPSGSKPVWQWEWNTKTALELHSASGGLGEA